MVRFPRINKIASGILTVLLCHTTLWAQQKDSPLNIVFIFADDLGYGDLGCFTGMPKRGYLGSHL